MNVDVPIGYTFRYTKARDHWAKGLLNTARNCSVDLYVDSKFDASVELEPTLWWGPQLYTFSYLKELEMYMREREHSCLPDAGSILMISIHITARVRTAFESPDEYLRPLGSGGFFPKVLPQVEKVGLRMQRQFVGYDVADIVLDSVL